ncbi:MAG: M20/M25/M40 family metallo-hydrolase [Acidobacteriota bacterium]|nr:M20/M25/M40 family metallo-hydrolase [Acidobacteriota bacterium]MDH3525137.1 M20/M25/M40 family metallo-hydrolase [Acidobacteriota bacterium]
MTSLPPKLPARLPVKLAVLALAVPAVLALLPTAAEASQESLRRHVTYLASDALDGRLTGTDGEARARDYLVAQLDELGVEPLPGAEGLVHPFEFTAGTKDAGSVLTLATDSTEEVFTGSETFQALSLSDNGSVTGEVVFAGYGLVLPESAEFGYDSYAGLDVEGKIVVALRYFPEAVDQETRAAFSRYSGLRFRALQARERGAKGLLLVTGPNSPNAGETIAMSFDSAIAGSGIIAASASGEVGDRLFSFVSGKTLAESQTALDDGNPHVAGFAIPGVRLTLDVRVERERRVGHNLVGVLPRNVAGEVDKPYVMIGAHYDHLGRGGGGNSLARKEEVGGIHHGADDNASGVAAVLEMVSGLAAMERRRDVIVALWSGEELGVLGSNAFVEEGTIAAADLAAYVNLDMVGRARDNKVALRAMGSSSIWPEVVERANVPVGLDLTEGEDPYLPTDTLTLNQAEVPSIDLFTGAHEDYHRPTDTADLINYEDLERIARFGTLVAANVINRDAAPDFLKVEPRTDSGGDRDSVRAFTGTIPDYTTEVEGLLLSGVIAGGPADEAGLQEGDVIVEFGGQKIANIYDYTYALDAVKIGEPVLVVLERDGERMEVTITPRARD